MLLSKESESIRNAVVDFERRIEEMHLEFQKYYQGIEPIMPNWEKLEWELLAFSRKKIMDLELSKNLDRVLYKFQNRKRIWLAWTEEVHHLPKE